MVQRLGYKYVETNLGHLQKDNDKCDLVPLEFLYCKQQIQAIMPAIVPGRGRNTKTHLRPGHEGSVKSSKTTYGWGIFL